MAINDQHPLKTERSAKPAPREILGSIDLTGKTALVTGGYSGIGLETVRALASAGAQVFVPARSRQKAEQFLATLDNAVRSNVHLGEMDLGDLGSVKRFAADMAEQTNVLHMLINNAGIMACPQARVGPGWDAQFGTNHLGHFVLTNALLPLLRRANGPAGGARVVSLSSTAHLRSDILWDDIHFERTPYDKWNAYAQSKTANSLFAVELDAREKANNIRAFAVHPGGILTPLQRHLAKEEMIALGWIDENGDIPEGVRVFFKTPAEGAATSLWCALSEELEGRGGLYCENCNVAPANDPSVPYVGVGAHAVDNDSAQRLWDISAKMTGIGS